MVYYKQSTNNLDNYFEQKMLLMDIFGGSIDYIWFVCGSYKE